MRWVLVMHWSYDQHHFTSLLTKCLGIRNISPSSFPPFSSRKETWYCYRAGCQEFGGKFAKRRWMLFWWYGDFCLARAALVCETCRSIFAFSVVEPGKGQKTLTNFWQVALHYCVLFDLSPKMGFNLLYKQSAMNAVSSLGTNTPVVASLVKKSKHPLPFHLIHHFLIDKWSLNRQTKSFPSIAVNGW